VAGHTPALTCDVVARGDERAHRDRDAAHRSAWLVVPAVGPRRHDGAEVGRDAAHEGAQRDPAASEMKKASR